MELPRWMVGLMILLTLTGCAPAASLPDPAPLLVQEGDLPAGYAAEGAIALAQPPHAELPAPGRSAEQTIVVTNSEAPPGHVRIFLYHDAGAATAAFDQLVALPFAYQTGELNPLLAAIGERRAVDSSLDGTVLKSDGAWLRGSLVFTRCGALVDLRLWMKADPGAGQAAGRDDAVAHFGAQLDQRLRAALCQ